MGQQVAISSQLQAILDQSIDGKKVFGTSFTIQSPDFYWHGASGELSIDSSYFIASTTKLFTTAQILYLKNQNQLNWDDPIASYLPPVIIDGLHRWKGKDYSRELTIRHLMAHTSGLPDYLQDKSDNGGILSEQLFKEVDQGWSFEEAITRSKTMKPKFAPGTKNKAHYSDTNYQLLGKIIENLTGLSYAQACDLLLIQPLKLKNTYLYTDPKDSTPADMRYKHSYLKIPKAMASFGADGGMVSTSADLMVFLEAFFSGKLFPIEYISEMQIWNSIFFPVKSGVGIHLFKVPWFFNPTGKIPYLIGHSGLSGALAYYSPEKTIYLTGTVNQVAYPDASFRTMIKLLNIALSKK
ncbi:serine hydrolase [Algoriphagus sp. AK58]|uniref:serine hydrolase domain-containing protein n=1 Tax=Algoriphagus sp. AK58 TaxID=1406877 RepID=UPI00164FBD1E|nr:serine hydrolase domain-containing protein [Algoriphagus sp. AK58]MBC6365840.1 alkaline D-peptidase [Algoriphagus sp. AK58]